MLYRHIIADVRNINRRHKDVKTNRRLQNFLCTMLNDASPVAAKISLDALVELYRRNIWRDEKTVNMISTACFSRVTKVAARCSHPRDAGARAYDSVAGADCRCGIAVLYHDRVGPIGHVRSR